MENNYTYLAAYEELQQIVSDIEDGEVSIDELTVKIARASELLAVCKAKLTASEAEVDKLLQKLAQEGAPE
ncbi:exodeoxyribonuclease VII small subunit [Sphingobacterium humi]|uniref:Exodeoxyribonuclease VII small subunit n=1 Tax=Sphingobacterium humi TaxID=1796905 RepID=A0A6N8L119_9SPHI|nr:exodeoxyribonuclease VII small subunit [Sphingobacterium humi]MVZ61838.1 exodeoxyribonuclease VII small subunit [Sphingobacterium humi]